MNDSIDQLQLIDPGLIRRIRGLGGDGLFRLAVERVEELNKIEHPEFHVVYAYRSGGMEHYKKHFYKTLFEDADSVIQGLIHDLAFIGKPIRLTTWQASGYLDHASSARVETTGFFPARPGVETQGRGTSHLMLDVEEDTEANCYRRDFDILSAEHLDLIADSIRRFENLDPENAPVRRLEVKTMAKTLRSQPELRAAYIYRRQYKG